MSTVPPASASDYDDCDVSRAPSPAPSDADAAAAAKDDNKQVTPAPAPAAAADAAAAVAGADAADAASDDESGSDSDGYDLLDADEAFDEPRAQAQSQLGPGASVGASLAWPSAMSAGPAEPEPAADAEAEAVEGMAAAAAAAAAAAEAAEAEAAAAAKKKADEEAAAEAAAAAKVKADAEAAAAAATAAAAAAAAAKRHLLEAQAAAEAAAEAAAGAAAAAAKKKAEDEAAELAAVAALAAQLDEEAEAEREARERAAAAEAERQSVAAVRARALDAAAFGYLLAGATETLQEPGRAPRAGWSWCDALYTVSAAPVVAAFKRHAPAGRAECARCLAWLQQHGGLVRVLAPPDATDASVHGAAAGRHGPAPGAGAGVPASPIVVSALWDERRVAEDSPYRAAVAAMRAAAEAGVVAARVCWGPDDAVLGDAGEAHDDEQHLLAFLPERGATRGEEPAREAARHNARVAALRAAVAADPPLLPLAAVRDVRRVADEAVRAWRGRRDANTAPHPLSSPSLGQALLDEADEVVRAWAARADAVRAAQADKGDVEARVAAALHARALVCVDGWGAAGGALHRAVRAYAGAEARLPHSLRPERLAPAVVGGPEPSPLAQRAHAAERAQRLAALRVEAVGAAVARAANDAAIEAEAEAAAIADASADGGVVCASVGVDAGGARSAVPANKLARACVAVAECDTVWAADAGAAAGKIPTAKAAAGGFRCGSARCSSKHRSAAAANACSVVSAAALLNTGAPLRITAAALAKKLATGAVTGVFIPAAAAAAPAQTWGALVAPCDPDAPAVFAWDAPHRRAPVHVVTDALAGAPAERWGLPAGAAQDLVPVSAVVRAPHEWGAGRANVVAAGGKFASKAAPANALIFALQGCAPPAAPGAVATVTEGLRTDVAAEPLVRAWGSAPLAEPPRDLALCAGLCVVEDVPVAGAEGLPVHVLTRTGLTQYLVSSYD